MVHFLRLLVVLVGWIVSIAYVGAYAAYFVRPGVLWWLQVLALGLPILAALLVPLVVASYLVRRRRLAAVQFVLLVLFLVRHAPFGLLERPANSDEAAPLRVITYNTHGGVGYMPGGDGGVVELVQAMEPDLVCLQEFGAETARAGPGTASRNLESLGYRHVAPSPEGRRETRRPILTRMRVVEAELLPLSRGNESYATRAVIEGSTGQFSVYNVHLVGFSSDRPWRGSGHFLDPRRWISFFRNSGGAYVLRSQEAAALKTYIDEESLPYLVCGDFNSTSNQWVYRRVAKNLQDAFELAGKGWGKTYHARVPVVRIDYIFASPEWRVMQSDVLTTGVSDHRAVLAMIDLTP